MALLVRSRDGRPARRRRRPGRARGDRRDRAGRRLRLALLGGDHPHPVESEQPQLGPALPGRDAPYGADPRARPRRRLLLDHRRRGRARSRSADPRRALSVRRLLRARPALGAARTAAGHGRRPGLSVGSLSSFGEDACGRVHVVSLARVGQPAAGRRAVGVQRAGVGGPGARTRGPGSGRRRRAPVPARRDAPPAPGLPPRPAPAAGRRAVPRHAAHAPLPHADGAARGRPPACRGPCPDAARSPDPAPAARGRPHATGRRAARDARRGRQPRRAPGARAGVPDHASAAGEGPGRGSARDELRLGRAAGQTRRRARTTSHRARFSGGVRRCASMHAQRRMASRNRTLMRRYAWSTSHRGRSARAVRR